MTPQIALVNAAAFVCTCKLEGFQAFQLDLADLNKFTQGCWGLLQIS